MGVEKKTFSLDLLTMSTFFIITRKVLASRSWGAVFFFLHLTLLTMSTFFVLSMYCFIREGVGAVKKISSLDFTTHVNLLCTISVNIVLSGSGGAEKNDST